VFVVIGKLRRPHGVHGTMLMEVLTDYPERIQPGLAVFVGEEHRAMQVSSRRQHAEGLLVGLEGCDTPELAGAFRNSLVFVERDAIPELPEGEYYHHQILGLRAVLESGASLGVVTGILETGANDVCVVRMEDGKEILLPMIEAVVLKIEPAKKEMLVRLLPGLLGED